jgi:hypothetical protein
MPWSPDRRPIYEWASDHVELPSVLTKRGKFDIRDSRHFIGPFEAVQSDFVREVNVRAPVRGGKSLIADISVPWFRMNDPAATLWVFQTDEIAKEHAEERMRPILKAMPAIKPLLPESRHHDRTQDIIFADGLPLHMKGPAPSGLQSKGFRLVICDELWMWKQGILGEAKGRLGDFVKMQSSKLICMSQGGQDGDDWETQFDSGERNEWSVPCLACGHFMIPQWTGFRADGSRWGMVFDAAKDPGGNYDADKAVATVRFVCEKCGHEHEDSQRTRHEWNRMGKYVVVGATNASRKSFHWNAIIDFPWKELVLLWLSARKASHKGDQEPQIQFFQKRMAEPKSERTVHSMTQPFQREQIDVGEDVQKSNTLRIGTFDRQSEDVYWGTIREWTLDGSGNSRRLWFGRLFSDAAIDEVCKKFKVKSNPSAYSNRCVFLDSGYRPKGQMGVYASCARYGWIAFKGADESFFFHTVEKARVQRLFSPLTFGDPGEGTSSQGLVAAPLYRFASQPITDRLQALIDSGNWIEPLRDDESEIERQYAIQMSSEFRKKKVNKFTGEEVFVWVCPSGNNHAWDCSKMQVAAALMAGAL